MATGKVESDSGSERASSPTAPDIPDHQMLHLIGEGSYGYVWLARNVLGTLRAVKVVYRNRFKEQRPYDREFSGIKNFERISGTHEGLVNVLHVGRNDDDGYFYYVMELADDAGVGQRPPEAPPFSQTKRLSNSHVDTYRPHTLELELSRRGRLPTSECAKYGLMLTEALEHLHLHDLVHRDIKPSNVIFVKGRPKLADIGTLSEVGDPKSIVGTPGFMPPEGPGTPQADIFSLGKVLYEISTGKGRDEYPRPMTSLAELSDRREWLELNEVIARACESNARRRYQSATDLGLDLALLSQGKSVQRRYRRRKILRLILGASAVVGAVGSIWIGTRRTAQIEWREFPIRVTGATTQEAWDWHDIAWLENFGWLVGGREENGGPLVPVGDGRMLLTKDGGKSWHAIDLANFESGRGTNSHFNSVWTDVGPITSITIDRPAFYGPDGKISHTNGLISTATGIYLTEDATNPGAKWVRLTPSPDAPSGYSYFAKVLKLWSPERLYTVGWQGIAYWTQPEGWELQKETFDYDICDVIEAAGDMWAVGRAGEDEFGAHGSASHGAVYRLRQGRRDWERVPMDGIEFKPVQGLYGIATAGPFGDIFAVGASGVIIRGVLRGTNCFWKTLRSGTQKSLFAVAFNQSASVLWVVGERGTILKSEDNGDTWISSPCQDQRGDPVKVPLKYIRFIGREADGWIVGGDIVLKYQPIR